MLVHTDVTKYLEFKAVDGSYVLNKGKVEKVPGTDYEALRSPLIGLFEKRRLRSFLMCAPCKASATAARVMERCPECGSLRVLCTPGSWPSMSCSHGKRLRRTL